MRFLFRQLLSQTPISSSNAKFWPPFEYLIILIIGLGFPVSAQSEVGEWTVFGARPLAMGNAFVAVADDYNALFYNPAGIARIRKSDSMILGPGYIQTLGANDTLQRASKIRGKSEETIRESIDLIEKSAGKHLRFGGTNTSYWIERPYGIGLAYEFGGELTAHRDPSIDLEVGERAVMPIAYGLSLLNNRISIGVAGKIRFREGINHVFTLDLFQQIKSEENDNLEVKDFFEGGYGFGSDIGLLFTPLDTLQPTIGISVADIGQTRYYPTKANGFVLRAPVPVTPTLNLGFSIRPPSPITTSPLLLAFDFHSISDSGSFGKKLNLGLEIKFNSNLRVQTGVHQGYGTFGTEVTLGSFILRFARYTEEIGVLAGNNPDHRYIIQMKLFI